MKRSMTGFYCYRIFSRLYFHIPMLFVYFYEAQLSVIEIELMLAVYGLVLMTAPKLLVNFKNSHKQKSVIMCGEAIKAAGLLCLVLSWNTAVLLLGQILCGLGYSFTAGTESVLLRKLFQGYKGSEYEYKHVESKSNSYMYISFLTGGVLGSIVYQMNYQLIFFLSVFSNILAFISMFAVKEQENITAKPEAAQSAKEKVLFHETPQQKDAGLSFWKIYYALSRAFALAAFVGFLPYYFFLVVDTDIYWFSAILSLFNLFGFLSSRVTAELGKRFGYRIPAVCTSVILAAGLIVFAISDSLIISVLNISLLGLASGGVRPITLANLNVKDMSQSDRTKALSSMEQQYGFWNAFLLIAGGLALVHLGFTTLMLGLALSYALLTTGNFLLHKANK